MNYYNTEMEMFWKFAMERHMVYRRKELELRPPPWTDNDILNGFKFTCIFRELDRGTKFVTNVILNNAGLSDESVVFNVIAYRLFNKIETFQYHGFLDVNSYSVDKFDALIHKLSETARTVFTSAFIVSGYSMNELSGMDKISRLARVIGWIRDQIVCDKDFINIIMSDTDMSTTYKALKGLTGLGPFLAYQIAVDLSYWHKTKFGEDDFVIMGPGAKRGIDWLFTEDNEESYEEKCFWLRDRQYELMDEYGIEYQSALSDRQVPYLTAMSIENEMCEASKYFKAYYGVGRPRNRYDVTEGKARMSGYKKEPWMGYVHNIYSKPQNLSNYLRIKP